MRRTLLVVVAGAFLLPACSGGQSAGSLQQTRSPRSSTLSTQHAVPTAPVGPTQAAETSRPPSWTVTKLLVFIEENHSYRQMRNAMPYTFGLARQYGYANSYYAMTHPSLPNYIAIVSGQRYGVSDDRPPSAHPLQGSTVFGQALARGRTATVYADGMPERCSTVNGGDHYAVRHNPWTYFEPERQQCLAHDLPFGSLAGAITGGRLPNVGMVVPNTCHDAHDCSLAVADRWFKGVMTKIFDGPDWRSGHLAIILTADEDDRASGNKVLTVVIHPSQHSNVVSRRLDHYSLTRLYEDVVDAPYLSNARTATSMSNAFGLPVG